MPPPSATALSSTGPPTGRPTDSKSNLEDLPSNRFELELEFVQCLASPAYLHHLATTGVLAEPSFLAFLEYLQYWKEPQYVKYLSYPHCLHFLNLLIHNSTFRRELAMIPFRNFVHEQQFYSWQHRARQLYGGGLPVEEAATTDTNAAMDSSTQETSTKTQSDNNGTDGAGVSAILPAEGVGSGNTG